MFKLLWKILKDEKGGFDWKSLVDPLGFFEKGEESVYDPYSGMREKFQRKMEQ